MRYSVNYNIVSGFWNWISASLLFPLIKHKLDGFCKSKSNSRNADVWVINFKPTAYSCTLLTS